jgi:phosphoribosyl-AMP cyclohydrolase
MTAFDPASLAWDARGLIPAIAQSAEGETSGHVQRLVELRVDCDRDCLLLVVEQEGPACHTNRRSCFYTAVREGAEVEIMAPVAER